MKLTTKKIIMIVDKIQEYIDKGRIIEAELNISIYGKLRVGKLTDEEVTFISEKIKESENTLKQLKK